MSAKNVGTLDRNVRLIIGVILIIAGIFYISTGSILLGFGLLVVSLISIVTALRNTCLLYSLFGISTCKARTT